MKEKLKTFLYTEEGLTIVEYAAVAGIITLLYVGGFTNLGGVVDTIFRAITGF